MARKRKRTGYNRRSHAEHPGVSIQLRGGVAVLRYDLPRTTGKGGRPKQKQEVLRDPATKQHITSRERAKPFAIRRSRELAEDRRVMETEGVVIRGDMTWADFQQAHLTHLKDMDRSAKTVENYEFVYKIVNEWWGRPRIPAELKQGDLVKFVRHIRNRNPNYAVASLVSITRQFKALLNFGRKAEERCVRLDEIALGRGLDVGRKPRPVPVSLATNELRTILEHAGSYDDQISRHPVFPFLAFLMITGTRRGEAARLRWSPSTRNALESWCDFDGNRLMIFGKKTGVQRVVSLTDREKLRRMLLVMKESVDTDAEPFVFGGTCELAFGNKNRDKAADQRGRNMKWPIQQICKSSSVKFRIKDFRSTNATFLANSDLYRNLYELSAALGHDYQVLTRHYAQRRELPASQARATDVADILGIGDVIEAWTTQRTAEWDETGAPVIPMNGEQKKEQGVA